MLHILLADPDPAVRAAFRLLLPRRLGASQVDEVVSMAGLLQILTSGMVLQSSVCLLLIDWRLPNLDIAWLRMELHHLRLSYLLVGMSINHEDRSRILMEGADAYIYKGDSPERVIQELQFLLETNS